MDDNLQIVITSVMGKTRGFTIARRRLRSVLAGVVLLGVVLGVTGILGFGLTAQNLALKGKVYGLRKNLSHSQTLNDEYRLRLAAQEQEKEELMQNALAELNRRSRAIESILSTVGVDIQIEESSRNAGGPYASPTDISYEDLTLKADQYLETIQFLPLGAPVPGTITSKYGKRPDPINKRMAFHGGIDIRNQTGTKIMATADGTVVAKGYTRGFGNYVVVDHGNNFRTRFLHMKKSAVDKGEKLSRGQLIGFMGSTGRSTGPHLHYEISYRGKSVDPLKFMRIAKYVTLDASK